MILDPEGGKLSKRHGATSVGEYREMGYLPQALVNYLALLSWSHGEDELLERERLVREFELERLSPALPCSTRQAGLAAARVRHAARPGGARGGCSPSGCPPARAACGGGAGGGLPAVALRLRRRAGLRRRRARGAAAHCGRASRCSAAPARSSQSLAKPRAAAADWLDPDAARGRSPATARGAGRVDWPRATCSCPCASRSPGASTAPNCTTCSRRSIALWRSLAPCGARGAPSASRARP